MKKILITLVFGFSISTFAQSNLIFEDYPKNNTVILFEKTLSGEIEIDGHIFKNKDIKIQASIIGIKIFDKNQEYQYRECDAEKCSIIHLTKKNQGFILQPKNWYNGNITTSKN